MSEIKSFQELNTEGWYLKVGDVYSNPYEASHFKITKIELKDGSSTEDALIYGERVHPYDYSKRVIDLDVMEENEYHRAWYINDSFSLETP